VYSCGDARACKQHAPHSGSAVLIAIDACLFFCDSDLPEGNESDRTGPSPSIWRRELMLTQRGPQGTWFFTQRRCGSAKPWPWQWRGTVRRSELMMVGGDCTIDPLVCSRMKKITCSVLAGAPGVECDVDVFVERWEWHGRVLLQPQHVRSGSPSNCKSKLVAGPLYIYIYIWGITT
jgi:hypothetical protein